MSCLSEHNFYCNSLRHVLPAITSMRLLVPFPVKQSVPNKTGITDVLVCQIFFFWISTSRSLYFNLFWRYSKTLQSARFAMSITNHILFFGHDIWTFRLDFFAYVYYELPWNCYRSCISNRIWVMLIAFSCSFISIKVAYFPRLILTHSIRQSCFYSVGSNPLQSDKDGQLFLGICKRLCIFVSTQWFSMCV